MSKPTLQARAQFLGDVPNPKTPIAELWMMGARTLLDEALDEIERLRGAISDDTHREERLERIAKLALADIRTHSRDVDDYLETLEYIAAIARGLKDTK